MYKVKLEEIKELIKRERGRAKTKENITSLGGIITTLDKYDFKLIEVEALELPIDILSNVDAVDWVTLEDIFEDVCLIAILEQSNTLIKAGDFYDMVVEWSLIFGNDKAHSTVKALGERAIDDVRKFRDEFGEMAELAFPKGVIDLDSVLDWHNIVINIPYSVNLGMLKIKTMKNIKKGNETNLKKIADKNFSMIKLSVDQNLKNTPIQKLKRRPRFLK